MSPQTKPGPKKKLVRVSEEYELSDVGDRIADKWEQSNPGDDCTLKQLRDEFNRAVLRSAMQRAGIELVPGEVEYAYEYLFNEDASFSDREDTRHRLERAGVDVDGVVGDFIKSPQTIHNYLRDVHGIEANKRKPASSSSTEEHLDHIKPLDRRYESVAKGVIQRLVSQGALDSGDYDVSVECVVTNTETNESMYLMDVV